MATHHPKKNLPFGLAGETVAFNSNLLLFACHYTLSNLAFVTWLSNRWVNQVYTSSVKGELSYIFNQSWNYHGCWFIL
jgi:hypothetical protein